MDLIWNPVINQDSKTSPKMGKDPSCSTEQPMWNHHVTGSFIHELTIMQLSVKTETKFFALCG